MPLWVDFTSLNKNVISRHSKSLNNTNFWLLIKVDTNDPDHVSHLVEWKWTGWKEKEIKKNKNEIDYDSAIQRHP